MSKRRFTLGDVAKVIEARIAEILLFHDVPKEEFQRLIHEIYDALEALPAPEEKSFERKVWAIKLLRGRYANDERGILTFLSKREATTYKLSPAKVIPVTVTYRKGHHD